MMNGIWEDYVADLICNKVYDVQNKFPQRGYQVNWIEVQTVEDTRFLLSGHTEEEYKEFLREFDYVSVSDEAVRIRIMMSQGNSEYGILGFLTDYDNLPDWKQVDTTPPSTD